MYWRGLARSGTAGNFWPGLVGTGWVRFGAGGYGEAGAEWSGEKRPGAFGSGTARRGKAGAV